MVHRTWSGRVGTPAWWLSCALGVWACLSVCVGSAYAQGSCDEASATPTAACMQLARDRLDAFATRDSGLMLMRWVCRRAGSKDAAQACVEFGDADRASILWGSETKEGMTAFHRGCALGHAGSCAAFIVARYADGPRGTLDGSYWGVKRVPEWMQTSFADDLKAARSLCEAGSMRGCVAQGTLLWLGASSKADSFLRGAKPGQGVDKVAAIPLFEKACKAGERLGCLEHAAALLSGEVSVPGAVKGARVSFEAACKGRDQRGCGQLASQLDEAGSAVPKASRLAYAERGCEQGHVSDCYAWVFVGKDETPVVPYERTCALDPNLYSCALASIFYKDGDRGVQKKDPKRAAALAKAGCTKEMKRRPGDDEKTHVSFVRYACTTASNDEVASGRWDAAIEFEARACNAGAGMACDAMLELEVTRDARACVAGQSSKKCTSAASRAVSMLATYKRKTSAQKYTELRAGRLDLLGEVYGASCSRWKTPRHCALSKVIARAKQFSTARVACGLAPGPACDNALGMYPELLRAASAQKYDKALALLIDFDLDDWRALADSRCAAKSGAACYMRGMEQLGALGVGATDVTKARANLGRGCDYGFGESCGVLATMIHEGKGGPKDRRRARQVARKGCDLGSDVACEASQKLERYRQDELSNVSQLERDAARARDEANAAGGGVALATTGVVLGMSAMVGGLVIALVGSEDPDAFPALGVGMIVGGGVLGAISGPALGGAMSDADRADRRARQLESKAADARRRAGPTSWRVTPGLAPTRAGLAPYVSIGARF